MYSTWLRKKALPLISVFDVKIVETRPQPANDFFLMLYKNILLVLFMWPKSVSYVFFFLLL